MGRLIRAKVIFCIVLLAVSGCCNSASAQITDSISDIKFGQFNITSVHRSVNGQYFFYIQVFKESESILTDSAVTDAANCQGFSVPKVQPFKDYFIFSKHATKTGKTYILTRQGVFAAIAGGTFWAATKDKLLFILAEKDYRNLVVFSLEEMKTIFEKFSCDEFTDWYYGHGTYFGKVSTECGTELKSEKEVSEWMHPVEIEQFDVKRRTLNEMHITDEQVEKSKPLIKYASCN